MTASTSAAPTDGPAVPSNGTGTFPPTDVNSRVTSSSMSTKPATTAQQQGKPDYPSLLHAALKTRAECFRERPELLARRPASASADAVAPGQAQRAVLPVAPTKGAPELILKSLKQGGKQQGNHELYDTSDDLPKNVFKLADALYLDSDVETADQQQQQAHRLGLQREREEDLGIIHLTAKEVLEGIWRSAGVANMPASAEEEQGKQSVIKGLTSERALRAVARRALHVQQLVSRLRYPGWLFEDGILCVYRYAHTSRGTPAGLARSMPV